MFQGIFVLLHIRIVQQWQFRAFLSVSTSRLLYAFSSAAWLIKEQCEGILTGNIIARFAPPDFASSIPRSTAFL